MNLKKLASFALGAVLALTSVCALADGEDEFLHYTFDSAVFEDVTLCDGTVVPVLKADGDAEALINISKTTIWESGWYEYDTDRNGVFKGVPTSKEMYVEDGVLKVKFSPYNRTCIRIPGAAIGSVVNLSFDMNISAGVEPKVLIDNNNSQKVYPTCTIEGSIRKYSFAFKVKSGDFLCIENQGTGNLFFDMDNYIISKESDFSEVSSYPDDNSQDVFADKSVSFEFSHDLKSASNITVNDETLSDADYKLDGKTLYVFNVGGKNLENAMDYNIKIGVVTDVYDRTIRNIEKSFRTIDEFILNSVSFEKNGNERKLSIGKIVNNSSSDRELEIKIIAIKDGEMLKSAKSLITIPSGAETDAALAMNLDDIAQSGYTVKALLWDVTNGIMPIMKHEQ